MGSGRIFVERSDLSPDGSHLIYFTMGGLRWVIPATGGTWTAISQVPSLKAVALWGQGDTWGAEGCSHRVILLARYKPQDVSPSATIAVAACFDAPCAFANLAGGLGAEGCSREWYRSRLVWASGESTRSQAGITHTQDSSHAV